jgi:hypothetical protein
LIVSPFTSTVPSLFLLVALGIDEKRGWLFHPFLRADDPETIVRLVGTVVAVSVETVRLAVQLRVEERADGAAWAGRRFLPRIGAGKNAIAGQS